MPTGAVGTAKVMPLGMFPLPSIVKVFTVVITPFESIHPTNALVFAGKLQGLLQLIVTDTPVAAAMGEDCALDCVTIPAGYGTVSPKRVLSLYIPSSAKKPVKGATSLLVSNLSGVVLSGLKAPKCTVAVPLYGMVMKFCVVLYAMSVVPSRLTPSMMKKGVISTISCMMLSSPASDLGHSVTARPCASWFVNWTCQ